MPPAIEIDALSKSYRLGVSQYSLESLRENLSRWIRGVFVAGRREGAREESQDPQARGTIWALRDVSFTVEEGEVVGIIGRNGAGKSTLLKILSRITVPTSGSATIRGRLSSLLEVGTGFHPELTGRENIFLNGSILGMRRAETRARLDEIIAFSGIEEFIDTPVKRYSSGMYVRLAFSVAAHLEPEILLVDEVLAVGDFEFQRKCLGKISEVSRSGRTVLFVSHNMAAVENLCTRAIVLEGGRVVCSDEVRGAVESYLESVLARGEHGHRVDLSAAVGRRSDCRPLLRELVLLDGDDAPLRGSIAVGGPLKLAISFELDQETARFDLVLGVETLLGQLIFTAGTPYDASFAADLTRGLETYVCEIPSLPLLPGEYSIRLKLLVGDSIVDLVEDAARIVVSESDFHGTGRLPKRAIVAVAHRWKRV